MDPKAVPRQVDDPCQECVSATAALGQAAAWRRCLTDESSEILKVASNIPWMFSIIWSLGSFGIVLVRLVYWKMCLSWVTFVHNSKPERLGVRRQATMGKKVTILVSLAGITSNGHMLWYIYNRCCTCVRGTSSLILLLMLPLGMAVQLIVAAQDAAPDAVQPTDRPQALGGHAPQATLLARRIDVDADLVVDGG